MKLQAKLSNLFNIQPGEGRLVSLMLLYGICLGVPGIVTETTAYSLFLVQFGAEAIPYVYIGFALVTTVIGLVFTKLEGRLSSVRLLTLNLTLLLLVLGLLRLLLALSGARWPVAILTIWADTVGVLLSLAFTGLVGHIFTLRQGKRLFGLLGAVFTLSEVVSGFAIPLLVGWVGPLNLLLVAAGAVAGALAVQLYIIRLFRASSAQADLDKAEEEGGEQKSLSQLIRQPYIALIFGLAGFNAITYYFLDNAFFSEVETHYLEAEALAGFIGVFSALAGLGTTIFGAFVSGRLISRYGLGVGLLVMPVTLLISGGLSAFVGTFSQAVLFFFWLVVITKFFNEMLQASVDWSASLVLYQPLPAGQRLSVQTAVESMVQPLAGGIAGAVLLLLGFLFTFDATLLLYALLPMLALWIGIGLKLNRAYPQMLMGALAKRKLSGSMRLSLTDASSLAVLRQALQSPRPGMVIYALNLLAERAPEALGQYLPDLLRHPAPEVREEALRQVEQLGFKGDISIIRQALRTEPSVAVRAAALRALAAVGQADDLEQLRAHLEDSEGGIRLSALVGLLRYRQAEVARQKLIELGNSSIPAERCLAAQVIGETVDNQLQELLERLLQDACLPVRRAALIAAGKARYPQLWPQVAAAVALPEVRSLAAAALASSGEAGLAAIQSLFTDPAQDRETRLRLARLLGRINHAQAGAVLLSQLSSPDEGLRSQILAALSHRRYQAGEEEHALIQAQIKAEAAYAAWVLATLVDLGDDQPLSLLTDVFRQQFQRCQARLFLLLALIYDRQVIFQARDNLDLASAEKRVYALEVIDTLLAIELKRLVLPLIEELPLEERLQRLQSVFPQARLGRQQRLLALLASPEDVLTPWLRTCAIFTAGVLEPANPELAEKVIASLRLAGEDKLLQETAAWSLARLDGAVSERHLALWREEPQLAGVINQLAWRRNGGQRMLSTIEKVLILKTVNLFSGTPTEILAEVASLLAEVELPAGKTIFEKGDQGDCMYIVVSGRVKAHDGEHIFNYLEEGHVFGEMAVLDPEPRVASITAVEDTHLLRLDQEPFYELMEDRIEVARGVIQVLSGHLRNRVRDVSELKARLQQLEAGAQTL